MRVFKGIIKFFLVTVLVVFLIGIGIVGGALLGLVDVTSDIDFGEITFNYTSYVYYIDPATGQEVEYEKLYDKENRVQVSIKDIPQHVIDATVAIEDERYYQHIGFDFKSTAYAVYEYLVNRSTSRGASTITQQLVKNLTGDKEVSWERKVQEIVRAVNLERKKSKDEIMELYLNTIYLANGCSGIGSAAKFYFGKTVQELSVAEAASIIGITQYPTRYDPLQNPKNNKEKQELVLKKMLELGYLNQYQYDQSVAEPLQFRRPSREDDVAISEQSYFGDQVIEDVLEDFQSRKGLSEAMANKLLYTAGLKIYCTMDPVIQGIMDDIYENRDNFPLDEENGEYTESAMVVLDAKTAEVKGMVGGIGKKTASRTLNRATHSTRQPGSTIKPIAIYAPALNEGLITPFSIYEDKQLHYDIPGSGVWEPKNYYSGFRGPMTVMKAVEISTNPVPIQILDRLGITTSFDFLQNKMGITSLAIEDRSLASLALGGLTNGVSVLELTAAYTSFANRGVYTKPRTYTKVIDHNGKVLMENVSQSNIAISEQASFIMTELLANVCRYGTGTAARFSNEIEICGKTGTTDDDKDRWFSGFTPYYAASVWIGFDQPRRMSFLGGVNPTIPIWTDVMARIHEAKGCQPASFPAPQGLITVEYCTVSGKKPTSLCSQDPDGSRVASSTAIKGMPELPVCDVHVMRQICTVSNQLAISFCPPEKVENRVFNNYNEVAVGLCTWHDANTQADDLRAKGITVDDFNEEVTPEQNPSNDELIFDQGESNLPPPTEEVPPADTPPAPEAPPVEEIID